MSIKSIRVIGDGYVYCKSRFYSVHDSLSAYSMHNFSTGINRLTGEIDSGIWAVSYLMSMYKYFPKDFVLLEKSTIMVNEDEISLDELQRYSCYMDTTYPLFSGKKTVRNMIDHGIKETGRKETPENIRNIFHMSEDRFERPLSKVGNEVFRAMAAIGYSHGKQVFCFPWLSAKRFEDYHGHMTDLLDILENLQTIVILPLGNSDSIKYDGD